jgi:hypothetical protein
VCATILARDLRIGEEMAMPMLASFNFHTPFGAVATVVGVILGLLILLGALRSMLLGSLCGGLICGGLSLVAAGPRRVAVLDPERIALAIFFALVGLVLGAIAGTIGEAFRGSQAKGRAKKVGGSAADD